MPEILDDQQRGERMRRMIFTICSLLIIFPFWSFAQPTQNSRRAPNFAVNRNRGFSPFRKKASKAQKKLLQPNKEDLAKYSQFLLQPKTGMFRLLPDPGCEDNPLVLKVDEACRNVIPESSFYSFREEEHTSDILSDIRLKNNFFISDGIYSQGILVKLGDLPVETITPDTDGISFLSDYVPQTQSKEAHKQFLQMKEGVISGKHEYRKVVLADENMTYAMRVIAYRGNLYRSYRGVLYDVLAGDRRIDMMLAFRVVRKDKDGSMTLLWKELQSKESPKLKFSKKNNQR